MVNHLQLFSPTHCRQVINSRELQLVSQVFAEGKALVVVANKMDALPGPKERKVFLDSLHEALVGAWGISTGGMWGMGYVSSHGCMM